jgi:hypothetical protein
MLADTHQQGWTAGRMDRANKLPAPLYGAGDESNLIVPREAAALPVNRNDGRCSKPGRAMIGKFKQIYVGMQDWAAGRRISAVDEPMDIGKAGEFDGSRVTLNSAYPLEERIYYLIHALGSTVCWSLDVPATQAMFDELRSAKENPAANRVRIDRAIARYRAFESQASAYAVGLIEELGHFELIAPYTNFMRADLESMTEFHQNGRAPVWRTFFASWNKAVADGRRQVPPFDAVPIPPFRARLIEKQEILQQQDDDS